MLNSEPTPRTRVDCACPKARHEHGTRAAYERDRCRCLRCRAAHSNATQAYRNGGTWRESYIDAGETKLRLQALSAVGVTTRRVAAHSGLSADMVGYLRAGKQQSVTPRLAAVVEATFDALWLKGRTDAHARRCSTQAHALGYVRDPLEADPVWCERERLVEAGVSEGTAAILAERLNVTQRTITRKRAAA